MRASASPGFPLLGAVTIAVIAIVVVLVLILAAWRSRQPGWRPPRASGESARTRRIQDAAAEDVAAVEEDAKYFRPDAPGHHEDDL